MSLIDIKQLNINLEILEQEKNIPKELLISALEEAFAAAYKKDYGKKGQIIRCEFNSETGDAVFSQVKTVVDENSVRILSQQQELELSSLEKLNESSLENEVEEKPVYNAEQHIMIDDAKKIRSSITVGEEIVFSLETEEEFGRVAAQTAKQVIMQRIREAEKAQVSSEYQEKIGQLVSGVIQKFNRGSVYIDLGKTVGVISNEERIPGEFYRPGAHIQSYIYDVSEPAAGGEVLLSRSHPRFIGELFAIEAPEIAHGIVIIKNIAREPGSRSKMAVTSLDESIDPIGACVGQSGSRVNAVRQEINGEKVDIIPWSENQEEYIANALAPAQVLSVSLDHGERLAHVAVYPDQLSLAIGKEGQNARLAAKLTGWRIDIKDSQENTILEENPNFSLDLSVKSE
jgi:transcription termination/antitermination protein NusA